MKVLWSNIYAHSVLIYWWILLVQFFLLREEVQTVPQRYRCTRPSLGNGQRQIAEHIERIWVVGAHWAMQRAPQLAWEQVCVRKVARTVRRFPLVNWWKQLNLPSSPTILLSSLSKCFFHMAAASSEILFKEKRQQSKSGGISRKTTHQMNIC